MGNYAGAADAEPLESLSLRGADFEGEGYAGEVIHHECSPPLSGSASYLREILASEESLRAAFEPVLRAARCPASELVDRSAFACAVDRIVGYFNPAEPIALRGPSFGPPYNVDEALGHFRAVLGQLAARLEELERPEQQLLRPPLPSELGASVLPAAPGIPVGSSGAEAPLFTEDLHPQSPGPGQVWRSWQPAMSQPAMGGSEALRPQPPVRLTSWSPSPARRACHPAPPPSGGLAETTGSSLPWASMRNLSPPPARAPAQVPPAAGGEGVEASLEGSRARVAGLRRALGREEELLRHQAEETRRLEHLQRDLEAEAEAAARRKAAAAVARAAARSSADKSRRDAGARQQWAQGDPEKAWPLNSLNGADRRSPGGAAEDEEAADAALGGPMSLEDVKYHLRTVLRLKRRVVELEGALDGREEQVAVLSDEFNRRAANLGARVAAA